MTCSRKFDHVSILYKQLKLLKLENVYKLELSNFMHQLSCNMTPKVFEKNLAFRDTKLGATLDNSIKIKLLPVFKKILKE